MVSEEWKISEGHDYKEKKKLENKETTKATKGMQVIERCRKRHGNVMLNLKANKSYRDKFFDSISNKSMKSVDNFFFYFLEHSIEVRLKKLLIFLKQKYKGSLILR